MIHAAVGALCVLLFVVLAYMFTMAEIELNPVSRNLLGMGHTRSDLIPKGRMQWFDVCGLCWFTLGPMRPCLLSGAGHLVGFQKFICL